MKHIDCITRILHIVVFKLVSVITDIPRCWALRVSIGLGDTVPKRGFFRKGDHTPLRTMKRVLQINKIQTEKKLNYTMLKLLEAKKFQDISRTKPRNP